MDSDSATRPSLLGHHYALTLSHSIHTLTSDLATQPANEHVDRFHSLIQARVDPPLESIWVYASLSFRNPNSPKSEPADRISSVKVLFDFVVACSSACGPAKSIALLAPVVYNVHAAVSKLLAKVDLSSKSEKKTMREVKSLVEAILGYVNVCCGSGISVENDAGLVSGFPDLVRLWAGSGVSVQSFFPLLSGKVVAKLGAEGCEVAYLVGCVTMELFLLKLCLSLRTGSSKPDPENELRIWAIGSITGLRNFYFFETLVTMLLEKTLPLEHLQLSSEEQAVIRKVLYDAVILAEYSFLNPEKTAYLPSERVKKLAMARLLVTHDGVLFSWEHRDRKRSIAYTDAFSDSSLASQIKKWINHNFHVAENDSLSRCSSPSALIKWLVKLERKGISVFDDSYLRSHAEKIQETSVAEFKKTESQVEEMKVDEDLFYVDTKGEEFNADDEDENINDAVNTAFLTAAQSMKSAKEKTKKWKQSKSPVKKKGIKFVKYETVRDSEASARNSVPDDDDGSEHSE